MSSTPVLTTLAMLAFAANSLLARLALADGAIDAAGYTGIRLASGAIILALLLVRQRNKSESRLAPPGNWCSALALFVYALAFSLAYVRLGVALGALVLFTAVQITMIAWGLMQGERPKPLETLGIAVAFIGFVYLVYPGLSTPDPVGSGLMAISGVAWGVYSLRGRAGGNPLGETAGNFIRTVPMCLPLIAASAIGAEMSGFGVTVALASGVIASGLGYIIWYRALPRLTTTQAAIVQLTVPVIAALGAIAFLSETMTLHLVVTGTAILGGVALATLSRSSKVA